MGSSSVVVQPRCRLVVELILPVHAEAIVLWHSSYSQSVFWYAKGVSQTAGISALCRRVFTIVTEPSRARRPRPRASRAPARIVRPFLVSSLRGISLLFSLTCVSYRRRSSWRQKEPLPVNPRRAFAHIANSHQYHSIDTPPPSSTHKSVFIEITQITSSMPSRWPC